MTKIKTMHFGSLATGTSVLSSSICGYLNVRTTSNALDVRCKACLARMRGTQRAAARSTVARYSLPPTDAVAHEIHLALEAVASDLAPRAPTTPIITGALWAASCKGGQHRRCGLCPICEWERSAQLWAAVSPWNKDHHLDPVEGAPRWSSLAAALLAYIQHTRDGGSVPSALGRILERAARGDRGQLQRDPRKTDPSAVVAALDVLPIEQALTRACETCGDPLDPAAAARVLLERTPGLLADGVVSYEVLAKRLGGAVGEDALKGMVRRLRDAMTFELAAKGLVPRPRARGRVGDVTAATWRGGEFDRRQPTSNGAAGTTHDHASEAAHA
ncbi:MAG: hypothetical protein RLZZ450_3100 [Pseudomonadota bacterium]|jgi:hypothetical protein